MSSAWIYPLIALAGALQAFGAPMNAALYRSLGNALMASAVSSGLVALLFVGAAVAVPRPLPTAAGLEAMPWWAPLGGLTGVAAVLAGLALVDKVGGGAFTAVTVTAALAASIALDHYGLLGLEARPAGPGRLIGLAVMVAGLVLIARS